SEDKILPVLGPVHKSGAFSDELRLRALCRQDIDRSLRVLKGNETVVGRKYRVQDDGLQAWKQINRLSIRDRHLCEMHAICSLPALQNRSEERRVGKESRA